MTYHMVKTTSISISGAIDRFFSQRHHFYLYFLLEEAIVE